MMVSIYAQRTLLFTLLVPLLFCNSIVQAETPVAKVKESWKLLDLPISHEEHLNIEGIARSGETFWVIGSHSMKRITLKTSEELTAQDEKVKQQIEKVHKLNNIIIDKDVQGEELAKLNKKIEKLKKKIREKAGQGGGLREDYNHRRMESVVAERTREWLYRLDIKSNGEVVKDSIAHGSLRTIFEGHAVLSRFGS